MPELITVSYFLWIFLSLVEIIAILVMARYIVKLVEKLIGISTKSSEVLEKLSNDFRIRQDKD